MSLAVAEVGSAANKYRVLATLATGGMAEIFLARAEGIGGVARYVVLKKALRDRAVDPMFVRMFLEEAQLASQLNHPNIAQVLDIGQVGDSYFFTMEYVHGETALQLLRTVRAQGRDVPIPHVLTIIAHAAAGLHHAHDRNGVDGRPLGIVHRDVSPSNLMVSFEGAVKLVDFGVAKADTRTTETRTGAVKGKVTYLSPEQARGWEVDRRSDLFALGICMWELLAREKLFNHASDFDVMTAIVHEPSPPPSKHRPHLPAEIDAVVAKLLAKNPDERFQTAAELIEAIEAIAAHHGTPLSGVALGKFMHEVFGDKPVPWLEYEASSRAGGDGPDDALTVRVGPAAVSEMLAQLPFGTSTPPPSKRSSKVLALVAITAIAVGVAIAFFIGRSGDNAIAEVPFDAPTVVREQPAVVVEPIPVDAAAVLEPDATPVALPVDAAQVDIVDIEPDDPSPPRPKRPKRPPVVKKDCAKDPMSCQH